MRIIQFVTTKGQPRVGLVHGDSIRILKSVKSTYELGKLALKRSMDLRKLVKELAGKDTADYDEIINQRRIRLPLVHPDPYHTWISGTGLTHLGSASSRHKMHASKDAPETDSIRMFKMGLEGGKMKGKKPGVQSEWFYKGNGLLAVDPEKEIISPPFARDGGEEPELAGLYIIDSTGNPFRMGYSLGNEFSDHVMEKENYLYLAHSKLRPCSYGPELLLDPLPKSIEGISRIRRKNKIIWQKSFHTGETHMSHNFTNLEHHHFKYSLFRQPGDVHVHFFGTSVLSFADKVKPRDGDVFEIESGAFGKALRNGLRVEG